MSQDSSDNAFGFNNPEPFYPLLRMPENLQGHHGDIDPTWVLLLRSKEDAHSRAGSAIHQVCSSCEDKVIIQATRRRVDA